MTRFASLATGLILIASVATPGCLTTGKLLNASLERMAMLRYENNVLRGRLEQVSSRFGEVNDELEKTGGQTALERARAEMAQRLRSMGIDVTSKDGALVVTLAGSILFPPGSATLKPSARHALSRVSSEIKRRFGEHTLRVEGHTDNEPIVKAKKYKDNWELSTARALSVARYLIDHAGIKPHRLYVAGFGMYRPVRPNTSKSGRAANRRVELVILPRISVSKKTLTASR